VHEEEIEVFYVADNELVEAVGQEVSSEAV
jgi:hypothetical protein